MKNKPKNFGFRNKNYIVRVHFQINKRIHILVGDSFSLLIVKFKRNCNKFNS